MSEIKTVPLVFAAAGERAVAIAGDLVHVIDAAGPVFVQVDHRGAWIELEKALGVRVRDGFKGLRVRTDVAQTVRLMVGAGDVVDARTVLSGGTAVQIEGGDSIDHGAVAVGTAPVQVVASSLSRVSLLLQCLVGPVFIGKDNAVTVNNGVRLDAGQSVTLAARAAVWAVSTATSAEVRYLEEIN